MSKVLEQIIDEFHELKGQFVITQSHKIERLVAIGDDQEDYYWITYNGREYTWNSCVGRVIPLKGYLKDKDYNEFIRLAKLNHWDQTNPEEFHSHLDTMVYGLNEDHKIPSGFCFELN